MGKLNYLEKSEVALHQLKYDIQLNVVMQKHWSFAVVGKRLK